MSTPMSGDQVLGGSTDDNGWIGNTNPCPGLSALSSLAIFCSVLSSARTSASEGAWALGSPTGVPPDAAGSCCGFIAPACVSTPWGARGTPPPPALPLPAPPEAPPELEPQATREALVSNGRSQRAQRMP